MTETISYFSMAASLLYLVIVVACLGAGATAVKQRQLRWHRRVWFTVAILFIALFVLRWFGIEEGLRDGLREIMRSDGSYSDRRGIQSIIASIILAISGAAGFWWTYRLTRLSRGKRDLAVIGAIASAGAMLFLLVLRLVSLHAIDRLLYGPFKMNWIVDMGSSVAILFAAIFYVTRVRERA